MANPFGNVKGKASGPVKKPPSASDEMKAYIKMYGSETNPRKRTPKQRERRNSVKYKVGFIEPGRKPPPSPMPGLKGQIW